MYSLIWKGSYFVLLLTKTVKGTLQSVPGVMGQICNPGWLRVHLSSICGITQANTLLLFTQSDCQILIRGATPLQTPL